jgi:hypothetical protein
MSKQSVIQRRWERKNHKKRLAIKAVRFAISQGTIVRGACEVCGASKTHAHHDDYDKRLAVRWLCALHHKQWHLEHGEGANAHTPSKDHPHKKKSVYRGVSPLPNGTFKATVYSFAKKLKCVSCASELEAARAYDRLATEFHGAKAKLNFPAGSELVTARAS